MRVLATLTSGTKLRYHIASLSNSTYCSLFHVFSLGVFVVSVNHYTVCVLHPYLGNTSFLSSFAPVCVTPRFIPRYAYSKPVILKGFSDNTVRVNQKSNYKKSTCLIVRPLSIAMGSGECHCFVFRNSSSCAPSRACCSSMERGWWGSVLPTPTLTGKVHTHTM